MIPLSSYLLSPWRHHKAADYDTLVKAALTLDRLVTERHRFSLVFIPDASRFRDISEKEVARATRADMGLGDAEYPQYGTHADPVYRDLTRDNFYGLVGTKGDRPLDVITMNTASTYRPRIAGDCISNLFVSRRLWADAPDKMLPHVRCETQATSAPIITPLPAIFLGTAWTLKQRRKQGIMELVSRLHRIVAALAFGPLPQFATIAPNRDHDKLFNGRDIGAVIEHRVFGLPTQTRFESRVLFYDPQEIVEDARKVVEE